MSVTLQLLIALALIALNGAFVLAEFALVRVRATRIEMLARQGNPSALMLQGMLRELDLYLSALQMGITMASLALGWVGEPAVARVVGGVFDDLPLPWGPAITHAVSFALAFGVITFLHIVLGELVPRSVGITKSDLVAMWAAFPLKLFTAAFRPPIAFMAGCSKAVLHGLRLPSAAEADTHLTEEELRILLGSSEGGGSSLERMILLENVFDFGAAKVVDAMVPRDKAAFLSVERSWEENLAVVRARRFSRYPLCRGGLDSAFGLVHVKDLVLAADGRGGPASPAIETFKREILVLSPADPLQKALGLFTSKGTHLALVKSPEGEAAGIVTLEDILEELIGEVHDEFDRPQAWSLLDVLVPSAVEVGIEETSPEALFKKLVSRLHAAEPRFDAAEAVRALADREGKFSSAVGHGIAIPHARMAGLERALVAVGRSAKNFPFAAPDKVPVRLAFLILTPAGTPILQLRILARVASLVSNENLRRRLLRAKTAEHLTAILKTADALVAA